MNPQPVDSELCYLEASKVTSPAGTLAEFDVLSAEGESLGHIQGVVIEAAARRVRYFDVRSSRWFNRRMLVPTDRLAQIEPDRQALRLLTALDPADGSRDIDPKRLREFSDDDLLAFFFPPRAA